MTIDTAGLGAPITDIDDFVANRAGPSCHPADTAPTATVEGPRDARPAWLRWAALPLALAVLAAVWTIGRAGAPTAVGPAPETAPAGLEGFAELYVATFLTAGGPDGSSALDPFVVALDDIDALNPYERYVARSAAIRIEPIGEDYWSVLVAADVLYRTDGGYGPGRVEFYEVAIATPATGFVATAAPLPVAAPDAPVPYGTYGELRGDADDATTAFIAEFLDAYFGGSGRLPRLVTADSGIEAHAPFAEIEMRSVRIGQLDGSTWVTASVVVTTGEGVALPTSVTVRLVGDSSGMRIADLLPGAPPTPIGTTGS